MWIDGGRSSWSLSPRPVLRGIVLLKPFLISSGLTARTLTMSWRPEHLSPPTWRQVRLSGPTYFKTSGSPSDDPRRQPLSRWRTTDDKSDDNGRQRRNKISALSARDRGLITRIP